MQVRWAGLLAAPLLLVASPASAVEGGAEDRVTTFSVAIATGGPSSPSPRCSGTLIAPNVVLTVRHCISRLVVDGSTCERSFPPPAGAPSDFWVSASPRVAPSTAWKNVTRWVVPEPSRICGDDIALLVLAAPFSPSEATVATPVVSATELETRALERVFGVAGYGATSTAGGGGGSRRSRFDVPVRCLPGVPGFECDGALDYITEREFTGGAGPCTGDSGAAAISLQDRTRVFGVLSRGRLSEGSCSEGIYERTDVWRWLLAKTVKEAAPAGTSAPDWATVLLPEQAKEGELCVSSATCGGGTDCVSLDGERSFICARRCAGGCSASQHCENNVCVAGDVSDASGCASGGKTAPGVPLALGTLFAAVLVATSRRRRRSRQSDFVVHTARHPTGSSATPQRNTA